MRKPPESVHDRLNRELRRDIFGGWKVKITVAAILAIVLLIALPEPRDVTHLAGTVTGVTTLQSESGPILRVGVETPQGRIDAGTRARFVAPENGEKVCLQRTDFRWTGRVTFNLAPLSACDGPNSTSSVD